jgi:hypothetical protein
MKRSTWYLAAAFVMMYASAVQAGVIPLPPPAATRIAKADAVIVGKVEALEPQDVMVGNVAYRIAVVKINDGVKGVKTEKTLRIGFVPEPMPKNDKGPIVIRTGARPVQLTAGQEGLFILKKQDKENFYTIGGVVGYYINSDKNADFAKEVMVAKTVLKVSENPLAHLKAKDAEERLLAASVLIEKYRSFQGPKSTQEPIDAAESKLIMQALAGSDWKTQANFMALRPSPVRLFQQLGVTAKDGFTVPAGGNYQAAQEAWVRDNAEKYRIQRFVAGGAK